MLPLIIVILLVLFVAQQLSLVNALKGVDYECTPSKLMVAPGEKFRLKAKLTNRRRRFISFVQVASMLPADIQVHDPDANVMAASRCIRHTSSTFMMPRRKLSYNIPVSLPRRGRYVFHNAEVSVGDFLGFKEPKMSVRLDKEVVVYPADTSGDRVSSMLGGFLGNISVRRFIMEDPTLVVGFREYTGREPMKTISWSKTAQTRQMMVKTFDYTTEPTVSVILNVKLSEDFKFQDRIKLLESCYEITHTVCRTLEEHGIKYDFITNATMYGPIDNFPYVSEGLGASHFQGILEGLGKATYSGFESFESLIDRAKRKQYKGRSSVVITPGGEQEAYALLREWDRNCTLVISSQSEVAL